MIKISNVKFLVCFAFLLVAPAQEASQSEHAFEVGANAAITQNDSALYYFAEFDLGTLPSGEKGLVVLKLKNPTAEPFQFTEIVKSCNCDDIDCEVSEIGSDESVDFTLRLETPKHSSIPTAVGSISLVDKRVAKDERRPVHLRLKYKLGGLLNIEREMCFLEIPPTEEVGELRIPVLITDPIKPSNLKVVTDESLEGADFQLDNSQDGLQLLATVTEEAVKDGPISGTVKVFDTVSEREDSIFITLRRGTDFKLSPKVLRFRKGDDSKPELRRATVLLRIPEDAAAEDSEVIQVSARISDRNCEVKSRKIARRVVKVDLKFDFSHDLKEGDDFVEWKIVRGNEKSESMSRFIFVN